MKAISKILVLLFAACLVGCELICPETPDEENKSLADSTDARKANKPVLPG